MVSGILFVTFIGTRLLPKRSVGEEIAGTQQDFQSQYELQARLFQIKIPPNSVLVGKTLAKSRLGSGFDLNVMGITRGNETLLAPHITETIQLNDVLIVEGRLERIQELNHWGQLLIEPEPIEIDELFIPWDASRRASPQSGFLVCGSVAIKNRLSQSVWAQCPGD